MPPQRLLTKRHRRELAIRRESADADMYARRYFCIAIRGLNMKITEKQN